ncbi:alpha-mannosidase 2 [Selaginella moellendorffii]|nr:alpha-mannosidase 2 [Selaginella moellendorffii]|eukprot:XP_002981258.2 alpha-mannosidase 2 [Selaginella moellendorffii]
MAASSSSGSSSGRRKVRVIQRRHRLVYEILDCGVRGGIVLALLLLVVGMAIYSWSADPIVSMPGMPMIRRGARDLSPSRVQLEAVMDISTKELYDAIAFENKDGGAWTQGWAVKYRGDEWNREKLKVFVVPHSHNDPGWLRTVEEYYQERTKHILSTVVGALRKDPRRKFIWEEMSYLHRWWQDASDSEKQDFIRLVKSGQLEVVGGGWVMNDEANSHHFAIIEQITAGNLWLRDTIGVTPRNAWAIDPFGHSATMAYLLRRMGFANMLIQRTHYEVKKELAQRQSLEFMWRQGWDSANSTAIFCHMMPFYSYDIPHTCGPEPAVCCQFDYWRLVRVGQAQRCPWGYNPEEINEGNVRERAMLLLDQYRKKSTLYRSNTLLVPLGDDFRYVTPQEAELQFTNYQVIFDYISAHPELKASVQFGTLEDYFSTLRDEVARSTKSSSRANEDEVPGFPSLSGDFFTYADRMHDYWSGYYVSRPFYKAVDRVLEHTLRAANILYVFTHAKCRPKDTSSFPASYSNAIVSASQNLALFQHHDGVTGTARDHVVEDYGTRMHTSLVELQAFMAASVEALLLQQQCKSENFRQWYEPEESRSKFNMLAVKKSVRLASGQARRVVFFNPLEEAVEHVVMVVVDDPAVCVFGPSWASVDSQISPEWDETGSNLSTGRHRLHWTALVPALGLATFFVSSAEGVADGSSCKRAVPARIRVFNSDDKFSCPNGYSCSLETVETLEITNGFQTLGFDSTTGMLRSIQISKAASPSTLVAVEEDVAYYSSAGSGAYLFLPDGEAKSLVQAGGLVLVTEGRAMQEVHVVLKTSIGGGELSRSARLYHSGATGRKSVQALSVEINYHVALLDHRFNNKEIIARFKTGIDSGRVFHSDLNGFQTIRRETYDKIPLQGNYYPMPSLAFVQDSRGKRFSVHSRQALGVASLQTGWLEVMLDRRLTQDDGRGLGQGVMDNRPLNIVFQLLLEENVTSSASFHQKLSVPSLLSHRVGAQLNYPMHAFLGKIVESSVVIQETSMDTQWSSLASAFPCDLHLVGIKALRPSQLEDVEYGLLLQRRGWDESYCRKGGTDSCSTLATSAKVDLHSTFSNLVVSKVTPSSLNFLHDHAETLPGRKGAGASAAGIGIVEMSPMEIQAYKLMVE